MGKSAIDIFARVRPTKRDIGPLQIDEVDNRIEFHVPKEERGLINNTRENYDFRFKEIFDMDVAQDEVFDKVGRPVVERAFEGYNGTVFAYGQTGSGKTFTITGGDERYSDRGIIPRTISQVFKMISEQTDAMFQVYVSYLEIYSNHGYDLLHEKEASSIEDLPRVILREKDGQFHMQGLMARMAANEEEALNFLFMGDVNREVAQTAMNDVSSRSHCIFIIKLVSRKQDSDAIRTSKIHLVDLAGSERVAKTGATDKLLTEAKHINMSLSTLERVITQLSKGLDHVSYRDSFMTSVLRDSLGGNCKTVMIATLSAERTNVFESISTCRFAQRVAQVSTDVTVNEEVDPRILIKRLKAEIVELKEEIALLTGEERGAITESEEARVRRMIDEYIASSDGAAKLNLRSFDTIRYGWSYFRQLVLAGGGNGGAGAQAADGPPSAKVEEELRKLRLAVQQRDNEITILISMLQKKKAADEGAAGTADTRPVSSSARASGATAAAADNAFPGRAYPSEKPRTAGAGASKPSGGAIAPAPASSATAKAEAVIRDSQSTHVREISPAGPEMNEHALLDRTKAFEMFRKSYRKNEVIQENKEALKEKYQTAKELAAMFSQSKQKLTEYKALIERLRVDRALRGVEADNAEVDPEEERAKQALEEEKKRYREKFEQAKQVRTEIDRLHQLLEQSGKRLQSDFESWYAIMQKPRPGGVTVGAAVGLESAQGAAPAAPPSARSTTSASSSRARGASGSSKEAWGAAPPPRTGHSEADADIEAFYKAKQDLLAKRQAKQAGK